MNGTGALAEGLQLLQELLLERDLEPDGGRTDWPSLLGRLALVQSTVRTRVLEPLPGALQDAGDRRDDWARLVADLISRAAAVHFAAGDALECDRTLARAAEIAPEEQFRAELQAGRRDPAAFCSLQHARWLRAHGRDAQARKVLRSMRKATQEEPLLQAARHVEQAPRAIRSAPPLFRFNGIGVGLYGRRDVRDETHVSTYCVSILWVPVFPLANYRVSDAGQGAYRFYARERLGRAARAWQAAIAAAAAVALGTFGVQAYLRSPSRLARIGYEEGRRLEAAGRQADAMGRYLATATELAGRADVKPAAEGALRVAAASVKEPCRPEDVGVVSRVAAAFDRLPAVARTGAPAAYLSSRFLRWSEQLGATTPGRLRAALAVLDLGARIAEGTDLQTIKTRRDALRRQLADALVAADRPVDALMQYMTLADPPSLRAAHDVIARLGNDPSLWLEAEPEVRQWIARSSSVPDRATAAAGFAARLEAAAAGAAANAAVLEKGDERAIAVALARSPGDQELTIASAALHRERGDSAGCVERLGAAGSPGRLVADAQQLLGACLSDMGRLDEADQVLSALVDDRLARFQQSRREYAAAADELETHLGEQAQRGEMPPTVRTALDAAPEAGRQEVFQKWVADTMSKDARLNALRDEYLRHRAVARASLALGTVKLRQAVDAPPERRRVHLEAAERAFLSIREEAEGTPGFHLGLGQVFHRLGRPEDGAREMQALLDRGEPGLSLEVAEAYRDLGLHARTREITEQVHGSAAEAEWRQQAALKRSLVGKDLDDTETWLQRSDQTIPYVKTRLLETRGLRQLRDGKLAEAERSFAQVADLYDRRAAHDSSAANNAAVALLNRFTASGEIAHMKAAVKRLEASARLEPESAIVMGNLAGALEDLGLLMVLERWVRVKELTPDSSEARLIVSSLLRGPLRADLLAALRQEPALRKQLAASRQEQVLAPQNPASLARQLRWLRWTRDTAGLQALAEAVVSVKGLDTGDPAERRAWLSGARDGQARVDAQKELQRSQQRLGRVEKAGHAPTIACAYLLHADKLDTLAFFEATPEAYGAAAEAYRRALRAWPAAGLEDDLASALLKTALARAKAASPPLKAVYDKDRRVYTTPNLLYRAAAGAAAEEVRAALRQQPELAEVLQLRQITAARDPSMEDWITARLAGDAKLEQLAARVFAREDLAVSLAIDVQLDPADGDDQADLALFRANQRRQAAAR